MANFDIFNPPQRIRRMRRLGRGPQAAAGDADFSFARRLGGSAPRTFRMDEPLDTLGAALGAPAGRGQSRAWGKGELMPGDETEEFGRMLSDPMGGSVRRLGDPMQSLDPYKGRIGEVGVGEPVQDGFQAPGMEGSPLQRLLMLMSMASPLSLAAMVGGGAFGQGRGGFPMGSPRSPGGGGLMQLLQSLR